MKLHRSEFLKELKAKIPELRQPLNEHGNSIYLEVSVFLEFVQYHINENDEGTVSNCFEIVEKYLKSGNSEIQEALGISFFEVLNLTNSKKNHRSWAFELLPKLSKKNYLSFQKM